MGVGVGGWGERGRRALWATHQFGKHENRTKKISKGSKMLSDRVILVLQDPCDALLRRRLTPLTNENSSMG